MNNFAHGNDFFDIRVIFQKKDKILVKMNEEIYHKDFILHFFQILTPFT